MSAWAKARRASRDKLTPTWRSHAPTLQDPLPRRLSPMHRRRHRAAKPGHRRRHGRPQTRAFRRVLPSSRKSAGRTRRRHVRYIQPAGRRHASVDRRPKRGAGRQRQLHGSAGIGTQRRRAGRVIHRRRSALAPSEILRAGRSGPAASIVGERAVRAESRRCRHAGRQARLGLPIGRLWLVRTASRICEADGRGVGRDSASRSAILYQRRIAQLHRQIHRHNRRRGETLRPQDSAPDR